MCADGGDPAFAQHDDQVCPADLGQAMCDDKCCPAAGSIGDGALDLVFGGRVQLQRWNRPGSKCADP